MACADMKLLVLPGDGIGPEIVRSVVEVLRAADAKLSLGLDLEFVDIGLASLEARGTTLPTEIMDRIPEVDGVILGPVSSYDYPPRRGRGNQPLRRAARRVRSLCEYPPLPVPRRADRSAPADGPRHRPREHRRLLFRPQYARRRWRIHAGQEHGAVGSEDYRAGFRPHRARGLRTRPGRRKKVTAVHKANVLKLSDGLFLREVRMVAADFPDVELDEVIVDAAAALLVRTPDKSSVIVTTNMYGDILSDEASELSGSLGLGASINVGDRICIAQAQHGSAPDIAGRNLANPTWLILSTAMLLDWRGRRDGNPTLTAAAARIESAVERVLGNPATRTRDVGGTMGTDKFSNAVVAALRTVIEESVWHDGKNVQRSGRNRNRCGGGRPWGRTGGQIPENSAPATFVELPRNPPFESGASHETSRTRPLRLQRASRAARLRMAERQPARIHAVQQHRAIRLPRRASAGLTTPSSAPRKPSETMLGATTGTGSADWNYFDLLDEYGLPGSHNVNAAVLDACPAIVKHMNQRGDEYIGHGRTNAERQDQLWEEGLRRD